MDIKRRPFTFLRSIVKSYGPSKLKKTLWDEEFVGGKWDFIDNTAGDCVYPFLEKYANKGAILDLGCGPGNTANELAIEAYCTYVGVDISEAALEKGNKRSLANNRGDKNSFIQGDFINYVPTQQFDLILFRESMYHVPISKIKPMLDGYSQYLRERGVFVVRMDITGGKLGRPRAMVGVIEREFEIAEKQDFPESGGTVIVFRPRLSRVDAIGRNTNSEYRVGQAQV